jgi:hypothetical protein
VQVHKFLTGFGIRMSAPPYATARPVPPPIRDLLSLLLDMMSASRLHWRSAVLGHYIFAVLGPSLADTGIVDKIAALQLQHTVHGGNLLVKVRLSLPALSRTQLRRDPTD